MPNRYYREPQIIIEQPGDYTYAFTMRLLNSLSALGVKVWIQNEKKILHYQIHVFAMKNAIAHPDTIPSHE